VRKIVLRKVESIVDLDGTLLHTSVKEKIMPFIEKLDELEAERSRHDLASASTGSRRRTRSGTNLEVTGGERERSSSCSSRSPTCSRCTRCARRSMRAALQTMDKLRSKSKARFFFYYSMDTRTRSSCPSPSSRIP